MRPGRRVGYATAADGAYVAYETLGDGPVDVVWLGDGFFATIDVWWEYPAWGEWFEGLTKFSRLILHDRRATGFSSRDVAVPNLDTRVSDLLAVLDAVGADRPVVLGGFFEGAAPGVILAASRPERVHSLFWFVPKGRSTRAPDYPWGYTPAEVEADRRVGATWGSDAYGRLFIQLEAAAQGHVIDDGDADLVTKMSRRTCTPDAARQAAEIWFETDVRGVLPAVQASVLLIDTRNARDSAAEAAYIASLMPRAEVLVLPGDDPGAEHLTALRRLVGADRAPPDLDRMLATVLFTDIVESTARAAALGDAGWRRLLERHDAIVRLCLAKYQGREIKTLGDGILATFDGPSRGVRCAQEIVEAAGDIGIEIRAGLHTGEIERTNDDIAGIAVAIAARVAVSARPSEVLVSQTIKDLTAGSGIVYSDRDEHELKGVPDRWRLYAAAG